MMLNTLTTNRTFKVFFVCLNYWDLYNFRIDVLKHFINLGFEVHTVALKDEFAERISSIGCKTHFIKFNNRGLNPFSDIQLLLSLKKIYKKKKPQLIFHYAIKPNIYGSIASSRLKIPSIAVITGLGYAFSSKGWLSFLVITLYRYAFKNVKHICILNKTDRNVLINKRIVSSGKINLLQSEGINLERFNPTNKQTNKDGFTFLMATRILWSKGIGIFAEASEILQKKGYNFRCNVIGFFELNHPDTIPLKKLREWQAKKLINYKGFFEDVVPFFNQADCFVLPTYYHEGVPRSLLEACAMQVPVITSDNSGCKEVIKDNYNGLICKMNNASALSEKMEQMLLMKNNQLQEMGSNGRKLVFEKFNIDLIINEYDKITTNIK